ncbi:MAG: DUF1819 family protein [Bacteroidales bacterium]
MTLPHYTFSFTAGSALINETRTVTDEYLRCGDWTETEKNLLNSNALQKPKQSTTKRLINEIRIRLQSLTDAQLRLLAYGTGSDAKAMIWLAIAKRYAYISDFASEVLLPKYASMDFILTEGDYLRFFNAKYATHPEMLKLSDASKGKIRGVLLLMLRQLGLLEADKSGRIIRPYLSHEAEQLVLADNPAHLTRFFYDESEIKKIQNHE